MTKWRSRRQLENVRAPMLLPAVDACSALTALAAAICGFASDHKGRRWAAG